MSDEIESSQANHRKFLDAVVAQEAVWTLEGEHGVASRISDDPDERVVLQFWSGAAGAEASAKDEWADHHLASITLYDFLFRWLPGMESDDARVGTNAGKDASGVELEPADLEDELKNRIAPAKWKAYQERLQQELDGPMNKRKKKKK